LETLWVAKTWVESFGYVREETLWEAETMLDVETREDCFGDIRVEKLWTLERLEEGFGHVRVETFVWWIQGAKV
jgi:hypothetical protein